ncbi:MAG: hypothetical protein MI863_20365 [Desulfobacterales bacterium]|nr:hypothetical protein [Desulfobacterales bacterium]
MKSSKVREGWKAVAGHKHKNPYEPGSDKYKHFENEFAQKTTWGNIKGIFQSKREKREDRVKARVEAFFEPSSKLRTTGPGYESGLYQKKNIIGSTKQKGQKPTVYFRSDSGRFGHITQEHRAKNNEGRELTFKNPKYSIANTGAKGVAQERIGDKLYHTSRNAFKEAKTLKAKEDLSASIALHQNLKLRYKDKKTFDDIENFLQDKSKFEVRRHDKLYDNSQNELTMKRRNSIVSSSKSHGPSPVAAKRKNSCKF